MSSSTSTSSTSSASAASATGPSATGSTYKGLYSLLWSVRNVGVKVVAYFRGLVIYDLSPLDNIAVFSHP
jgi:hypothetical protein